MSTQEIPAPDLIAGPSGGAVGKKHSGMNIAPGLVGKHPDLARKMLTFGKHPRAGHDRARWGAVNWADYRAQVGVPSREGPWLITAVDSTEGTVSETVHRWIADAEGLPWEPGVYTTLTHDERGLVMSDLPGEIAGALPFLDHTAGLAGGRILIAGLGLGIIPAWLLEHTAAGRIDVIEIDEDLIRLTTGAARACAEPGESWADDPRLRIHRADAHAWQPGPGRRYAAGWLDIWDLVTPRNLPSMDQLEVRYGPHCDAIWSWERPECEAMLARDQTREGPTCFIDETGYPHDIQE